MSASLVLAIALVDWGTQPYISLGFLYLFPILLAAGFLARWQIVAAGLGSAVLNELFNALAATHEVPRAAMVALALTGAGLFFRELVRNRQISIEHVRALEEQIRFRRDAEDQLRILIETSPAAILTTDETGRILLANQAAQVMLGSDSHRLQDDSIAFYLPDLQGLAAGGHRHIYRTAMQCTANRIDGESFQAEVWFSTYTTMSGPKLAAIIVDLTEELQDREVRNLEDLIKHTRGLMETASTQIQHLEGALSIVRNGVIDTTDAPEDASIESEIPLKKLTARELQVLRLVFEGLTNKEIAGRLQVSESSVKATLQQLFAKASVRTRSQLVRFALEHYKNLL